MSVKVWGVGSVSGEDDAIGILSDSLEDLAHDVDELELLEFLAADLDPVPADPVFKQELSELLWDMVQGGRVVRPRNH